MARIGMDVDLVTQHGSALKNVGDTDIPSLLSRVDNVVQEIQSNWWGPDAQHFQSTWNGNDRPALQNIAHEISTFGQQAIANAQIQSETSAASGLI